MAAVPDPITWSPNTVPTAAQFNTEIRDAVNFLLSPKRALVRRTTTNQDIPPQTWTRLTGWNVEDADTDTIHSSSDPQLVAKTAGRYLVFLSIRWEWHTFTGGARGMMICKNSNNSAGVNLVCGDRRRADEFITTAFGSAPMTCSGNVYLAENDYVECFVWHDQQTPELTGDGDPVNSEIYALIHTPSHDATTVKFGMVWIADR